MSSVLAVADDTFEREVLQSATPVLIDFWAPWCAPCRAIAPVVDELAKEYAGKLKVVKMNVDDNPRTPSRYGVRGIPNLILFQGGQVKEQIIGAVPKAQLVKAIDRVRRRAERAARRQKKKRRIDDVHHEPDRRPAGRAATSRRS